MNHIQKCQTWLEREEYEKVIESIEPIAPEERAPEMILQLGQAYLHMAKPGEVETIKQALKILCPLENIYKNDYRWNYQMGMAYYAIQQEIKALPYFTIALEIAPEDSEIMSLVDFCLMAVSLPSFRENFKVRTQKAWQAFAAKESAIRQLIDTDEERANSEKILDSVSEALSLAFETISFEIMSNGEKYKLILTPEGDRVRLFALDYFVNHVPPEVLAHWQIIVGRQRVKEAAISLEKIKISADDVLVEVHPEEDNKIGLILYCEKILPMLNDKVEQAWWILENLVDQTLGELVFMAYVDSFEVVEHPLDKDAIKLSQLVEKVTTMGLDLNKGVYGVLENYATYVTEPEEDSEEEWRLDTIAGSSNCMPLLNGYFVEDNYFMEDLYINGAVGGFVAYPLDILKERGGNNKVFDFREKLQKYLEEVCGFDNVYILGGATGIYHGYVDFIAWDLDVVLSKAKEYLQAEGMPWAVFHTFQREAEAIHLLDNGKVVEKMLS